MSVIDSLLSYATQGTKIYTDLAAATKGSTEDGTKKLADETALLENQINARVETKPALDPMVLVVLGIGAVLALVFFLKK